MSLNSEQKRYIVQQLRNKQQTQEELALQFGVSRWEIRTALMEANARIKGGFTPVLSTEQQQMLDLLSSQNIGLAQLERVLKQPAWSLENIQNTLSHLSHESMATLYCNVVLKKAQREAPHAADQPHPTPV